MNFASDNAVGAAPEILDAVRNASSNAEGGYGADTITNRVNKRFSEIFERDVAVFLVATGGAANGLALAALTPPYGAILCHEASHAQMDECGGPEFFTGGAKLLPIQGDAAKLTPASLETALGFYPEEPSTFVHRVIPKTVTITQATEYGGCYTPGEVSSLAGICKSRALSLHMDGARFANAIAHLGCAPADVTWRAGVDALSFGATKNGALCAEAVIFFDPGKATDIEWRRKQSGHLWSKSRFLGAQFEAYLADDLWLKLAGRANAMATRLAQGLGGVAGVDIPYPVEANEVFALLPEAMEARLVEAGAKFYPWIYPGDPFQGRLRRLVTSFQTTEDEADAFLRVAGAA